MERIRRGRQKIAMEKMKNESNLQVTFSKRGAGLFKKASELCTLCGIEVVIIVFSPGHKVYSFGHPSVDDIVNKYINNITNINPILANQQVEVPYNANTIRILNEQLTYVQNLLDVENARAQYLKSMKNDNLHAPNWWDVANNNELNFNQLQCLKDMMETLRDGVIQEQQKIIVEAQSRATMAYQAAPINPFDVPANALFASFPNVATDGAGPSVANPVSHQPTFF